MASVLCPTSPTILLRMEIYRLTMGLLLAGLFPSGRSDPGIASCSCPNRLSSCPTNIYFFTDIYYRPQRWYRHQGCLEALDGVGMLCLWAGEGEKSGLKQSSVEQSRHRGLVIPCRLYANDWEFDSSLGSWFVIPQ